MAPVASPAAFAGVGTLVAQAAAAGPRALAVQAADGAALTYAELDAASAALARALRARGVGPETVVAVGLDRRVELPVALLGVLRAGGAFLPLDPAYPTERVALMLRDAGARLLLTAPGLLADVPVQRLELYAGALAAEGGPAPAVSVPAEALAYVIYTSGSTGTPKGVEITHGALAAFTRTIIRTFGLSPADRVLQFSALAFDAAQEELWPTLAAGGRLVLRADDLWDPAQLAAKVDEHGITVLDLPTAYWHELVAALDDGVDVTRCPSLRLVIIGGEAASADAAAAWLARSARGVELLNTYGPTEATVSATAHRVETAESPVPIGRPLPGVTAHVLGGELHLGGAGVARGYRGRPAATAAAFVPDPFGRPGARLYRTGDRAELRSDGALVFRGRGDDQVKVRGFRIEPGEVEAALAAHPAVRSAAVAARDGRLVAWVAGAEVDAAGLRAWLAERLPAHMVPAAVVGLDRLPLTATGKLDRRALPDAPGATAGTAPRTSAEALVAAAFDEVLGTTGAGADDDFFALGGDSLRATRLVARLRRELAAELGVRDVFEHPTPAALARALAARRGDAEPPITRAADAERAIPSWGQRRMWFVDQFAPGDTSYVIPATARLRGALDVEALRCAISDLVARQEALRTRFEAVAGEPVQIIEPDVAVDVPVLDAPDEPAARALLAELAVQPFDLERAPLARFTIVRLGEREHLLAVDMHHIVSDGWSLSVLAGDLTELYAARVDGRAPGLEALAVQGADVAAWQRARLSGERLEGELGWWRERLTGAPPVLELPADRPRPAVQAFTAGREEATIDARLAAALERLGRERGATPFMTLLAAYAAVLGRFGGHDDVLVGTPVAGRLRPEAEPLVGFHVNTLPVRVQLAGDPSFGELLERAREAALGAWAHQEVPFEKLVEGLGVQRSLAHAPLVQALFVLQNTPPAVLALPGCKPAALTAPTNGVAVDLTLEATPADGGFALLALYNADLFEARTARRILRALLRLLEAAVADPDRPLSTVAMLGADEEAAHNRTARPYERKARVHELVEAQAAEWPQAVAVEWGDVRLSYRELDEAANRLAHALLAAGVRRGHLVAVGLERGPRQVVTLLAVLKAGAAYVPVDLDNPPARNAVMLATAPPAAIVTADGALTGDAPVLDLARAAADVAAMPSTPPAVAGHPLDLAYVIHTSGSTGRPKAIAVHHRAILRLVRRTDYVDLGPGDTVAQASNASFDAATFEIWGALTAGARLVGITRDELLDPDRLAAALRERGVDTLFVTTALLHAVADRRPDAFASLRTLLFGGEACDPGRVRRVLEQGTPRRLLHVYGPTEATTFATWHPVEAVDAAAATVPIGRPIANTTAYVLDAHGHPVPLGVAGELFLGGDGITHGYLGAPALTAERFVPDPYEPGARLYRTGDRVRREPDGALEFLGRLDRQVKVRGFRVEPAEIEAALRDHPSVAEAVVVVHEPAPGDRRWAAYVTAADGELGPAALRAHLESRLPGYMVPDTFTVLDALPLNASGKVDRGALPAPSAASVARAPAAAPRTATERLLVGVFEDMLDAPGVGIDDSFFTLGGHSLLATRTISRLRDELGVEVPLRALFETPTPRGLAPVVDALAAESRTASVPLRRLPRPGNASHSLNANAPRSRGRGDS